MAKQKKSGARMDAAERTRARQEQKRKRATVMCITVISVFCLLLLLYGGYRLSYHIDGLLQATTAMEADGEKLSPVDYNFYFYRAYYEYMNGAENSDYGLGVKPDESRPLSSQLMQGDDKITWLDFFQARANELIKRTYLYYHLAQDEGFVLSAEQEADIDYDFEEKIWFEAVEIGQGTIEDYLVSEYGEGMTEEIYRKNLRILFTANFYEEARQAAVEISDEALDAYYRENGKGCDIAFYRVFYLSGKGDDAQKMLEAKQYAEALAAAADDETEFIALAEEYQAYNDENSYWEGASQLRREQIRYSLSYFREWLAEDGRTNGDTLVAEASNGYYVAMFLSRDDNQYPVADLKWITFTGDDATERADNFAAAWTNSNGSVQEFFDLSADYRDIDYTQDYRKITSITHADSNRATVPLCMLDWCFDEAREVGNTARFSAEDGTIYYVFFDGFGELSSRRLAYRDLSEAQFREWRDAALAAVELDEGFFFYLTTEG